MHRAGLRSRHTLAYLVPLVLLLAVAGVFGAYGRATFGGTSAHARLASATLAAADRRSGADTATKAGPHRTGTAAHRSKKRHPRPVRIHRPIHHPRPIHTPRPVPTPPVTPTPISSSVPTSTPTSTIAPPPVSPAPPVSPTPPAGTDPTASTDPTADPTGPTDPEPTTAAPTATGDPAPTATTAPPTTAPTAPPSSDPVSPTATAPGTPVGNAALENQVIQLTNVERAKAGCDPVTQNAALSLAAVRHAQYESDNQAEGHLFPGELSLGDRDTAAGYVGWTGLGENAAGGAGGTWFVDAQSVMYGGQFTKVVNGVSTTFTSLGWMQDAGHKANILNCSYRDIGVGAVTDANGAIWWSQDFGTTK